MGHVYQNAQNAKWPNWLSSFGLAKIGHFGMLTLIWSCTSREWQNGPKGKASWVILAFSAYSYTWPSLSHTFWAIWQPPLYVCQKKIFRKKWWKVILLNRFWYSEWIGTTLPDIFFVSKPSRLYWTSFLLEFLKRWCFQRTWPRKNWSGEFCCGKQLLQARKLK